MGRAPCCDREKVKRGPWSPQEDTTLKNYVEKHGTGGNWIALPQKAGLRRCGKSCRLRWLNYLRPGIKHGGFTEEEDTIICSLFKSIGSRWSVIASHLPGRTDNDVKNYWNTKLKKKLLTAQSNLNPHKNNKNNAISNSSIKQTHHSSSPAPLTGAVPVVKSENCAFVSFSISADQSPSSTLASVDPAFMFNSHPSHMLLPEPASFRVPGLAEPPSYGGSSGNGFVVSPPQDISAASSCLTTENGGSYAASWSDNGGGGIDAFLMDLGLGPMDFLSAGGYGLLDKIGDVGSLQAGMPNLWPIAASSKPQEHHQGVTYS